MKLFIFLVLVLLISLLITYIGDVIKKSKEPIALNFKKWVFPNSAYPNWYRVIQNGYSIKMVDTGISLPTNKYSISFMYKITGISSVWTNVFHVTNVATADGGPWGGRNPSLWINPNYTNFHLRFATNGNNSDGFDQVGIAPVNTVAFVTFVFNINTVSIYVNGVNKVTSNFNGINSIVPTATLYIANPNEATGFVQLQDFTIYDGVLTNDQINIIYNESTEQGRKKKLMMN